jgi:hypothetical protein
LLRLGDGLFDLGFGGSALNDARLSWLVAPTIPISSTPPIARRTIAAGKSFSAWRPARPSFGTGATRGLIAAPIAARRSIANWAICTRMVSSHCDTGGLRTTAGRRTFLPRTPRTSFARWALGLLASGSNSCQGNAAAIFVDLDHPHFQNIADTDHFMGVTNISIRQPADVNQSAIGETDIDEHAKVDHVEYGCLQLHSWLQVLELHDAAAKDRLRETFPRIKSRADERIQNVAEQVRAHV